MDALRDDGRQSLEVCNERQELLIGLGVGCEVQAVCADGIRGGCKECLDVRDYFRKSGDEWCFKGFLGLQERFDFRRQVDRFGDRAGKPFAEIRDSNAKLFEDVGHKISSVSDLEKKGTAAAPVERPQSKTKGTAGAVPSFNFPILQCYLLPGNVLPNNFETQVLHFRGFTLARYQSTLDTAYSGFESSVIAVVSVA
jgi:hypothetical protein